MKIKLNQDFIKQRNLKIETLENGDVEINLDGDFLVFLNEQEVFAVSTFRKEDKFDETLPIKDLLVDQLQLVDYMQKSHGINLLDYKFNKDFKKDKTT